MDQPGFIYRPHQILPNEDPRSWKDEYLRNADPDFPPEDYSLRGGDLFRTDRLATAQVILEAGRSLYPDDYRILSNLGITYLRQGSPELALPLLQQSSDLGPKAASTYYLLGLTQTELFQFDEARANLRRAIKINRPQSLMEEDAYRGMINAYAAMANLSLIKGEPDKAISFIEGLTPNDQKNPNIVLMYAKILVCDHKYQKGEVIFKSLIKAQPNATETYMNLALLHIATKKWHLATEVLEAIMPNWISDRSYNIVWRSIAFEPKDANATAEGAQYLMLHRYPPAGMETLPSYPRGRKANTAPTAAVA